MDSKTLTDRIEHLYNQAINECDPERKKRFETMVRHYANKYHDVTGEWYIRDPAKNLYSKRAKRVQERIDVVIPDDYKI